VRDPGEANAWRGSACRVARNRRRIYAGHAVDFTIIARTPGAIHLVATGLTNTVAALQSRASSPGCLTIIMADPSPGNATPQRNNSTSTPADPAARVVA
jgi:hypothetical protein